MAFPDLPSLRISPVRQTQPWSKSATPSLVPVGARLLAETLPPIFRYDASRQTIARRQTEASGASKTQLGLIGLDLQQRESSRRK